MARRLVAEWSSGLRRDQREDPVAAVDESLRLLESVGLVRRAAEDDPDTWLIHAAACRYRPIAQLAEAPGTGAASLFDLEGEA